MSIKIGEAVKKGRGKYHTPVGDRFSEITNRYIGMKRVTVNDILEEDVEFLLKKYATDVTVDVLNIAEALCISTTTLYKMLRSERFNEVYETAKYSRSQYAFNTGYQALLETYEGSKDGSVGREQVNAARNLANYLLEFSKFVNPESRDKGEISDTNVNITLALPSTPFETSYEDLSDGD